jgi:hypothetical protein
MTPDETNAKSEFELTELVGLIGNAYVRRGLSPPSQLRDAVKHWLGLSHGEILAAIEQHFAEHRHEYRSGSGDGLFWMVEAAVRRAWQEKHPPRADEELERPRRKRPGRLRPIHHAGGFDVYDDRDHADAGQEDDRVSDVERSSGLPGYERTGVPIGEDEDVRLTRYAKQANDTGSGAKGQQRSLH